MRFLWSALGVLLLLLAPVGAQRQVELKVYPENAEIRAFLPYSHPKEGDLIPNGASYLVQGEVLSFKTVITAPGYHTREYEVRLLSSNTVGPNKWSFFVRLEPDGLISHLNDERHFHPGRFYGLLAVPTTLMAVGVWFLVRRRRSEAEALARAEEEVELVRQELEAVDPELEGRVVDNYTVGRLLGEGCYAKVYHATHKDYGDEVAIKFFKSEVLEGAVADRISREVAIGRDFQHPGLVQAFGFGTFREAPYIVMDFVKGTSLRELVDGGPLPIEQACELVRQLSEALRYAHGKGVIHRDLKPANIFLSESGQAKILDFGISKVLDTQHHLTRTGEALGTPMYMAPEQMKGMAFPATDVYALGAIFFEMLTGETVFHGVTSMEVLSQHARETPRSASDLRESVPQELSELIQQMLAKRPENRLSLEEVESVLQGTANR